MKIFTFNSIILCLICLSLILPSCSTQYDAEKVAECYCNCMKSNGSPKAFEKASKICDDKIVSENRYVKLWTVDMSDHELDKKISNETRDSVQIFMGEVMNYMNTHCCEETLRCNYIK